MIGHRAFEQEVNLLPVGAPPVHQAITTRSLVDTERYEIRLRDTVIGHVDVVGQVFVALAGVRYDHAVEVAQTLIFDECVHALVAFCDQFPADPSTIKSPPPITRPDRPLKAVRKLSA